MTLNHTIESLAYRLGVAVGRRFALTTEAPPPRDDFTQRVRRHLDSQPLRTFRVEHVARAVRTTEASVATTLGKLARAGHVRRIGPGLYRAKGEA